MRNRKLYIFIILIILIVILDRIFGWTAWLSDTDNFVFLEKMVSDNLPAAILIYIVLTVVGCVVLAVPGVTFAIIAGLLFGPWLGTLCCVAAATLGAMAAFIAGRYFLRDSIKPAIEKNKLLSKWLFDETGRNEMFILMITRLVPLFPYNLQNFAYGVTDISFAAYSVGSFIFMIPGTAMYTIGSAGITDSGHRALYFSIALMIAVIVFGMAVWLRKKYVTEIPPEDEPQEEGR